MAGGLAGVRSQGKAREAPRREAGGGDTSLKSVSDSPAFVALPAGNKGGGVGVGGVCVWGGAFATVATDLE